jgi:hypothetical protein
MLDWQFRQPGTESKECDMNWNIDEGNRKQLTGKVKEEILPRRAVLRGALAVGCSLLLPAAILGCNSKKDETSSSAAPASSPSTTTDSAAPAPSGKVSQASVQYQAQPKGEQKCGACQHFSAGSNTCELVEGQISPEGWCKLWAKKA